MSRHQQTGMRGVYLVAAELAARGLIVSPTSRSAIGADLLVTDEQCLNAFSVQVKTNAKAASFWLVGQKATQLTSKTHIYVLVNIDSKRGLHEFYVVPSIDLAHKVRVDALAKSTWYSFSRKDAAKYKDRWSILGAKNDGAA